MLQNVTLGMIFWRGIILRKVLGGNHLRAAEAAPGRLECNMPVGRLGGTPMGPSTVDGGVSGSPALRDGLSRVPLVACHQGLGPGRSPGGQATSGTQHQASPSF